MPKQKIVTVTAEQVAEVARIVGVPEALVKLGMISHARDEGYTLKFVEAHDPSEGGYFMALARRSGTDRYESVCSLCRVPVYHHDRPPANTVIVCMECGEQVWEQESGPDEEGEAPG